MRGAFSVATFVLVLWMAILPAWSASPGVVAGELLGGTLGGVIGAGIGVVAIGEIAPTLESRAARVATVIAGVTFGGGLGAASGVLASGQLLDINGRRVLELTPGENDIRSIAPGVYFVRPHDVAQTTKVVVQR